MSASEEHLLIVSSDGHVGPPAESYRSYVESAYRDVFDEWLSHYVPLWLATKKNEEDVPETWSEDFKTHWLE